MRKFAWGYLSPTSSFLSVSRTPPQFSPLLVVRNASLTSAINRGKRKSQSAGSYKTDKSPRNESRGDSIVRYHKTRGQTWPERDTTGLEEEPEASDVVAPAGDGLSVSDRRDFNANISKSGRFMGLPSQLCREPHVQDNPSDPIPQDGRSFYRLTSDRRRDDSQRRDETPTKTHVKIPGAVPYTTPASEFIYGTSAIQSALQCGRRKLYKLYVYKGMLKQAVSTDEGLAKIALTHGVQVKNVAGDWIRLMDKMSSGRPHNGYILEASPLPKLPVASYEPVSSITDGYFTTTLTHQSREEEDINGTNNQIPSLSRFAGDSSQRRYPFTLLLDGILDPGNLGAIIRSAYYLGVDAITFAARNSAPFSPVTIKASAGAAENIPLLSVINTVQFVDTSRSNGWRFFAAEAPGSASSRRDRGKNSRAPKFPTHATLSEMNQALTESPCVLMLGGEGLGLSSNLRKRADTFVGIPGSRMVDGRDIAGVDSLNVSVASALLCDAFLRAPDDKAATRLPEPISSLHTEPEAETSSSPDVLAGEQEPDAPDDEKLF